MSDERKTTYQCSNFSFKLTAFRQDVLGAALGIIATNRNVINSWRLKDGWLELSPYAPEGFTSLPFAMMTGADSPAFVWQWLVKQTPEGKKPDVDGSAENKAFEIEACDNGSTDAIRIRKVWALFHE